MPGAGHHHLIEVVHGSKGIERELCVGVRGRGIGLKGRCQEQGRQGQQESMLVHGFQLEKNGKRGVLQCSLKKDAAFRCRGTTADCILLQAGHAIACFAHSGRSSCSQVLQCAVRSVQHRLLFERGRALPLQQVRFASLFPFWQESFAKCNWPQTQGARRQPLPFVPERCPQTRYCRPTSRPTTPPAWSASAADTEEKELWNQVKT